MSRLAAYTLKVVGVTPRDGAIYLTPFQCRT